MESQLPQKRAASEDEFADGPIQPSQKRAASDEPDVHASAPRSQSGEQDGADDITPIDEETAQAEDEDDDDALEALFASPKRPCRHCGKEIACSWNRGNGTTLDEGNLRRHVKKCPKNPDRVPTVSLTGKKVGDLFGPINGNSEYRAPDHVRALTQGSGEFLEDAMHHMPDESFHPVLGPTKGEKFRIYSFFRGTTCCNKPEESMLQFRLGGPELFPKMYHADGRCKVAELSAVPLDGFPKPWDESRLRCIALNHVRKIEMTCTGCGHTIKLLPNSCARGGGPCRNCAGPRPDVVLYERSLQKYLDEKKLRWTTEPPARGVFAHHTTNISFTCLDCNDTWTRRPNDQVSNNIACPGCAPRHRAELCAYELYPFVFADAAMLKRGSAKLKAHANPFDVASANYKVIIEMMSKYRHVDEGKLPNDTEKMRAVLQDDYVYIMAHCEDHGANPAWEKAWMRCIVHALQAAKADPTPRVIHIRAPGWDHYDCMHDAAIASGFPYEDILLTDPYVHGTVRLPEETTQQTQISFDYL